MFVLVLCFLWGDSKLSGWDVSWSNTLHTYSGNLVLLFILTYLRSVSAAPDPV